MKLVIALLLSVATVASAQDIHIGVGRTDYDLSGTGHEFVASGRYTRPLTGPLHVEIGMAWFSYPVTTYAFPEVGLILRPTSGPIRPYIGAGAGIAVALKGEGGGETTLFAAGGLDLRFGRWGLRSELRVRSVSPWAAVTADITAGPTFAL
jgi:hypothetical protein